MNTEHHAKTLASMDRLLSDFEASISTFRFHRRAFMSLSAPAGTTYYRLLRMWEWGQEKETDPPVWLIVNGAHHASPIRFHGWRYVTEGHNGPGPKERFARVRVTGVDFWSTPEDSDDEPDIEYFLLVEKIPEF